MPSPSPRASAPTLIVTGLDLLPPKQSNITSHRMQRDVSVRLNGAGGVQSMRSSGGHLKGESILHTHHLRRVYDALGKGLDGNLDTDSLKTRLIMIAGRDIEEWEFRKMFKQIDSNGDGHIDFEEFVQGYDILMTQQERSCGEALASEVFRIRHPCEVQRMWWDKILSVILIYSLMSIPLRVCFMWPATLWSFWWLVDLFVDFYFLIDICGNFRTGYVTPDGAYIAKPCAIAKNYLKMWFWIDLITSLPITPMVEVSTLWLPEIDGGEFLRLPRVVRIVRIMRLLKLIKLAKLANMMSAWGGDTDKTIMIKLLNLIGVVYFIAHMCGCIWAFTNFGFVSDQGVLPEDGWVTENSLMTRWGGHTDWSEMKLSGIGIVQTEVDKTWAYVVSLYWAFTTLTTVGYGDVTPRGYAEVIWTICVMYIGTCAFGYIVGSVTTLIMHEDKVAVMVREKIENISAYMSLRALPDELQERVKQYFDTAWRAKTIFDENAILGELPSYLRDEIVGIAYRDLVIDAPMLRGLPSTHLTELVMRLHPQRVLPSQVVTRRGEIGASMYIVSEGLLRVFFADTYAEGAVELLAGLDSVSPGFGEVDASVSLYVTERLTAIGPLPGFLRARGVVGRTLWAMLSEQQRKEVRRLDPTYAVTREEVTAGKFGLDAVRVWLVTNIEAIAPDQEMKAIILAIAAGHDSVVAGSGEGEKTDDGESVGRKLARRRKARTESQGFIAATGGLKSPSNTGSLRDTLGDRSPSMRMSREWSDRSRTNSPPLEREYSAVELEEEEEEDGRGSVGVVVGGVGGDGEGDSPPTPQGAREAEGGDRARRLSKQEGVLQTGDGPPSSIVASLRDTLRDSILPDKRDVRTLPSYLSGVLTQPLWLRLTLSQRVYLNGLAGVAAGRAFSRNAAQATTSVVRLPGVNIRNGVRYACADDVHDELTGMPSFLGRGDFFGHYCVLSDDELRWEHPYTIVAEKSSLLLSISRNEFAQALLQCPDLIELLSDNIDNVQKMRREQLLLHQTMTSKDCVPGGETLGGASSEDADVKTVAPGCKSGDLGATERAGSSATSSPPPSPQEQRRSLAALHAHLSFAVTNSPRQKSEDWTEKRSLVGDGNDVLVATNEHKEALLEMHSLVKDVHEKSCAILDVHHGDGQAHKSAVVQTERHDDLLDRIARIEKQNERVEQLVQHVEALLEKMAS